MSYSFRRLLWTVVLLYAVMDLLYVFSWPSESLTLIGGLICILGGILCFVDPLQGLYLTILATHLGAIPRWEWPGLGMVCPGDFHIMFLVISVFFVPRGMKSHTYGPFPISVVLMIVLTVITMVLTPEINVALPGFVTMVEVGLIYYITLNLIRNRLDASRLIFMIGLAVLLSSIIHLLAYAKGQTLLLSSAGGAVTAELEHQWDVLMIYNKTSFFYASFIGSCAVAITLAVSHLTVKHQNRLQWAFWMVSAIMTVASSLVAGSRTSIVAAGIAGLFLVMTTYGGLSGSKRRKSIISLTIAVTLLITVAFIVQSMVSSESQLRVFSKMFEDDASTSMGERFLMWGTFAHNISSFPTVLFLGLGPDVPQRGPWLAQVQSLMNIPGLYTQIFSFHNFYLDIIIQNGILFFMVFLSFLTTTMLKLGQICRRFDDLVARDCFFALIAWLVVWVTHATGWSKPVLIPAELLGLSHILLIHYRCKI